ncbi:MAG: peptide chain release factor N(5)-glutamine methyltransferase [Gemmatimonas sp.]|nr:peptide chain release factor N(5)-glutamine methyltransferase [Gemmatimonas sp.]
MPLSNTPGSADPPSRDRSTPPADRNSSIRKEDLRARAVEVWTPVDLIRWTGGYLERNGILEARLTAELLLAHVLGLKRLDLYLQYDRPLQEEELAAFKRGLRRRLRREPLQYILGTVDFRELNLRVDRRALIPRPETEVLVGEVLAWCGERGGLDAVDIGTGSGAIALSLRREGTFGRVLATDTSEAALELAGENRDRLLGGPESVEFRRGGGYSPLGGERFDVIVSNPPYVAEVDRPGLEPEVVEWEPCTALFGGPDGLDVIRALVSGAPDHLRVDGLLAVEIGADQADAVAEMVGLHPSFRTPCIRKDLAGRERILLAEVR